MRLKVPAEIVLPDGVVEDPAALQAATLGASRREAIVWRAGTFTEDVALWPNDFPERTLGCGTCVDSTTGFDSYTPAPCSAVGVSTNPADPSCNWT